MEDGLLCSVLAGCRYQGRMLVVLHCRAAPSTHQMQPTCMHSAAVQEKKKAKEKAPMPPEDSVPPLPMIMGDEFAVVSILLHGCRELCTEM